MKKGHLIGIIIIAIAIGAIISTIQDSSTYASFAEAQANPENTFHVIGVLNKEKELNYDPTKDANYFSFYVIDNQGVAFGVTVKLRSIQALDAGHSTLVITLVLNAYAVFKDVGALRQVVDVEMRGCVAGALIVPKAVLIAIAAQHIRWLGPATTLVLHVNVFHVAVSTQDDPNNHLIANFHRAFDGP